MKLDIVLRHLSTLSLGKRVSNETESNSIPANESVVEGQVFRTVLWERQDKSKSPGINSVDFGIRH